MNSSFQIFISKLLATIFTNSEVILEMNLKENVYVNSGIEENHILSTQLVNYVLDEQVYESYYRHLGLENILSPNEVVSATLSSG